MSLSVRLFAAVVPPDDVVEDLDAFLSPRREAASFRWTAPDQWHLTLAFAPEVADRHLDDLVERLARAARKRRPFGLRVAGGGAFPQAARARVLWAGVAATTDHTDVELPRLATGTRAAFAKAGAEPDGGRFRAHLTLARLSRPDDVVRWVRLLDTYEGPAWTAGELTLVASHLGEGPRRRPRHEVLETFPLGSGAS